MGPPCKGGPFKIGTPCKGASRYETLIEELWIALDMGPPVGFLDRAYRFVEWVLKMGVSQLTGLAPRAPLTRIGPRIRICSSLLGSVFGPEFLWKIFK